MSEVTEAVKFEDGQIIVGETTIEAKKGHHDLNADIYEVPLEYSENGYFVGYNVENSAREIPSCKTYNLVGSVEVPADAGAVLEHEKGIKIDQLNSIYVDCTKLLESTYPGSERASWAIQSQEAKAFIEDPESVTPWLDAAAIERGVDRDEMARLISSMDLAYRTNHGKITGIRQRLRNDIDSAVDVEELAAIDISTPLKEARDQMELNI